MNVQWKIVVTGLGSIILVLVLAMGCMPKNSGRLTSPYLQDIILAEAEPAFWFLSPTGDKLLYDTTSNRNQAIIRFLVTDQEITIPDCEKFVWLDNKHIFCHHFGEYYSKASTIISKLEADDTLQMIPVEVIRPETDEVDALLKQAGTIYRLDSVERPNTLLLEIPQQNADSKYYLIVIDKIDQVLQE